MEKWYQLIFDSRINLKERMFRVVAGISMIAMTLTMIMGRNINNLIILTISLIIMAVTIKISIQKQFGK